MIEQYLARAFDDADAGALATRTDRSGSGRVRIVGFHLEGDDGRRVAAVRSGQPCTFVFQYAADDAGCRRVSVSFGVTDALGTLLFRNFTGDAGQDFEQVGPRGEFRCRVPRLPLRSGRFLLGFRVTADGEECDYIGGNAAAFFVESGDFYGSGRQSDHAPVLVEHEWRLASEEMELAHA
jgi:hypothetical protein